MSPVPIEWALRSARILAFPALHEWVLSHGARAAENATVLDANGLPDYGQANSGSGWRTGYTCNANASGIDEGSCQKNTGGENNGFFYNNGMLAFLNTFGVVLSADASDPNRICQWLPEAYGRHLGALGDMDINGRIWGKSSGQSFGMSGEAIGAMSMCP